MPKYKTAKRKVGRPKLQKAQKKAAPAQMTIQKMEEGFLQAPAKLAAIINKEAIKLNREVEKQKKAITKLDKQITKNEIKLIKADNATTPAARKKAKSVRKEHQHQLHAYDALNTGIQSRLDIIAFLTKKHAKLIALDKQLAQFDKEWTKNESKNEDKGKSKTAATTLNSTGKKRGRKPKLATAPAFEPMAAYQNEKGNGNRMIEDENELIVEDTMMV